jgi:L-lactate dehydrogenase complex protein LldE
MRVGLFIPCYMDAFEPEVAVATLELLERLGCTVDYPFDQTCCGQPMTNTGCHKEAVGAEALFFRPFVRLTMPCSTRAPRRPATLRVC